MVQTHLARPQTLRHLLAIDEGEHPLDIGTLQWLEASDGLLYSLHARQHKAMKIAVALHIFIYYVGIEHRQDAPHPFVGHQQLSGNNLIAQTDGFAQQRAVVVDAEQPLSGRIARIEQAGVHLAVALAEVITQHAIVKQQLHIVVLTLQTMTVVTLILNLHVLASLLLHEQAHILRHQVDASLKPQPFAYKRRFEQCSLGLQEGYRLTNILHLRFCLQTKGFGFEVRAAAVAQGLLAERPLQHLGGGDVGLVDNGIEGGSRKESQEDGLGVGTLFQSVDGIKQRMMSIAGEAGRQRRDVDEEVGFDDHLTRYNDVVVFAEAAVEQVQLHTGPQQLLQVGKVAALLCIAIVDGDGAVVGIGYNQGIADFADDAPDVLFIDVEPRLLLAAIDRQEAKNLSGHILMEHRRHKACRSHQVVGPVVGSNSAVAIRVATGSLHLACKSGRES